MREVHFFSITLSDGHLMSRPKYPYMQMLVSDLVHAIEVSSSLATLMQIHFVRGRGRVPREMYLDNGRRFKADDKAELRKHHVKPIYGKPYNPRGRGKIENGARKSTTTGDTSEGQRDGKSGHGLSQQKRPQTPELYIHGGMKGTGKNDICNKRNSTNNPKPAAMARTITTISIRSLLNLLSSFALVVGLSSCAMLGGCRGSILGDSAGCSCASIIITVEGRPCSLI